MQKKKRDRKDLEKLKKLITSIINPFQQRILSVQSENRKAND